MISYVSCRIWRGDVLTVALLVMVMGSGLSDMTFNSTEAEIAPKNPSRSTLLGSLTAQLGRFPSIQDQVATKKPFAIHLVLDPTDFELDGMYGRRNQFLSRAIVSTFARSSIAGRQVFSTNSAAPFGSITATALRAEMHAAEAKTAARAKGIILRMARAPR